MKQSEWVNIGIPLIVLLTGVIIGEALNLLDIRAVIAGAIFSAFIILGIVAIVWKFGQITYQTELKSVVGQIREIVRTAHPEWLFEISQMAAMEGNFKYHDIWIISPDLSNDTGPIDTDFIKALKKNLKRNIRYTYVVPDSKIIDAVLPNLYQTFGQHRQQCTVVRMPRDTFEMTTTSHIAIYNPEMECNEKPEVYWELPLRPRGYGKGFWVKVEENTALQLVGRFRHVIESQKP